MSDPTWLQLTLLADGRDPEPFEDALLAAGALAVTLTDNDDQPVLEPAPGETPIWPRTRVTGLFEAHTDIEAVKYRLTHTLGPELLATVWLDGLEDRDWVRVWLEDFHPMRFGRRLWVCPGDVAPPDPEAVNLLLDPGLAFGTGTHPTTALCLTWLDGAELQDRRVVDYGCGSGILGIAAALLGARRVHVVDIDPQALLACDQNAVRNGVADRIVPVNPDALAPASADVLLANILAGPLIALAPCLSRLLVPGGRLVLSGILREQAESVRTAYAPWVTFEPLQERDGWVLLTGRKSANAQQAERDAEMAKSVPLRVKVQEALDDYFRQLDGHPPPANFYRLVMQEVEPPLLLSVLTHTDGNQSRAAEILGMNRATLRKKLRQYGL